MTDSKSGVLSTWKESLTDGNPRRLLVMSLIDSLGTGLYIAGSVIFFTQKIGLSAAQVGLGLSIASVVGFAGVVPSGWVAERFGTWGTLLVFDVWRLIGFASYVFVRSFPSFLVLVCFLSIPEQAVNPLMQRLVEQVVGPERRTVMMGKIRTIYNVGFTLGAPLSGLAVKFNTSAGYNSLMLGDAITYAFAAILLYRLRDVPGVRRPRRAARAAGADGAAGPARPPRFSVRALRDGRYMSAAAVNGVLSLHMSILSIALPLWIIMDTRVPRYAVGPLLVINTALVIPLQVPASALAKSIDKSIGIMRVAGASLAGCCVLLAVSARLPLAPALAALAGAVAFLTFGEIAQSAGGWTLAYEMAPPEARVQSLATFGLSTSAQFIVGPLLLTDLVIAHGSVGWLFLAAVFLACALLMRVMIRGQADRTPSARPSRSPP
jgi:MFS family permease